MTARTPHHTTPLKVGNFVQGITPSRTKTTVVVILEQNLAQRSYFVILFFSILPGLN